MGQEVENVTQFTYLGSLQNSDGRCTADIACRIGPAASAMRSFQNLWRQQRTQLSTKLRFYSSCVVPILLYGFETWTLQSQDAKRLVISYALPTSNPACSLVRPHNKRGHQPMHWSANNHRHNCLFAHVFVRTCGPACKSYSCLWCLSLRCCPPL